MIDVKEIRVDNWVRSIHTGPFQMSLFVLGEIADDETYLDHIVPIGLNIKVLADVGFERVGRYAIGAGGYHIYKRGKIELLMVGKENEFTLAFYEVKITKLHQLQNIVFDLTGEELSYTPPTQTIPSGSNTVQNTEE